MPTAKATADPTCRRPTRYRGVTFRTRADGSRQYSVYHAGRYWGVEGGEQDALAKQAELRGRAARGVPALAPTKVIFQEVAEEYFDIEAPAAGEHPQDLPRDPRPRPGPALRPDADRRGHGRARRSAHRRPRTTRPEAEDDPGVCCDAPRGDGLRRPARPNHDQPVRPAHPRRPTPGPRARAGPCLERQGDRRPDRHRGDNRDPPRGPLQLRPAHPNGFDDRAPTRRAPRFAVARYRDPRGHSPRPSPMASDGRVRPAENQGWRPPAPALDRDDQVPRSAEARVRPLHRRCDPSSRPRTASR